MSIEDEVKKALSEVLIPQVGRSPVDLNIIREIEVEDSKVTVTLASTALDSVIQNWIMKTARKSILKVSGVDEAQIEFVEALAKDLNQISYTLAVMSGKGGVGKSLMASLLAIALNRKGYKVGILDADITGPSIPKMFGITSRPAGSETGIIPVVSKSGIEIISINLLLPNEDDAVIWRGPLIGRAIQQFWEEVLWGNLDYLLVDLPPGTADAPLTVMQSIPLSGLLVASTPQELAAMVVRKTVKMAQQMSIPVLGVVENMSYLLLPETGKKIEVFGKSKGEEIARAAGAPFLGQFPLDPELARLCDEGLIERYTSDAFRSLEQAFMEAIPLKQLS